MRVIELTIDDLEDFGGLDAISIVDRPAHESNFLAFNKFEDKEIYELLNAEQLNTLAIEMGKLGQPIGELEKEGWVIYKIEDVSPESEMIEKFAKPRSNPNPSGEIEFLPRIRYKYQHPKPAGRIFCQALIDAQRVYTEEDIFDLSSLNPVGPSGYNVLMWRGSYNCRGKWVKLTYLPKDRAGIIINDENSRKGLVGQEEGVLFDTRTQTTIAKGNTPNPRVGGWFNEQFGIIDIIDEMPVFETKEEAEIMAEKIGCKGTHEHQLDSGVMGYMPCDTHQDTSDALLKGVIKEDFESYNDYPKSAQENACRAIRWAEKNGWGSCGTNVGKQRAHQLCNGENISAETIARMASFERHRKNSKTPYGEGCGKLMWDAWGGSTGIEWAQRKLDQLAKEMSIDVSGLEPYVSPTGKTITDDFLYDNPCQTGYVAYGTKMKNGVKVPNCVPVEQSKEFSCDCGEDKNKEVKLQFSADEDKMEITGAALIPNKMILRKTPPTIQNPKGEFYYVFFGEETIKKLAEQFMSRKLLDATNIEHSDINADSVIKESWIVEDTIFDKSTAMGLEYPKGTWVITMKVKNPKVWSDIKAGKLNGYSVEGWFNENLLFQ